MLGYAPRCSEPICSDECDAAGGIIAYIRRVLMVAFKRLGARFQVQGFSRANPWTDDG